MLKLLKIVAALLVLVLAVALLAPLLVDPNDFRDDIRAQVQQATGRELLIEGDLRLSLVPWPQLSVERATLAGPPGMEAEPLARLARLELSARPRPLLDGRLEIERVRIEGLEVRLVRDASGRINWEGLALPAPPPPAAPGERAPARGDGAPRPTDLAVAVDRVELRDGRLVWDDRAAGQGLLVEGLDAQAGPLAPGAPLALHLAGMARDAASGLAVRFDAGLRAVTRAGPGGGAEVAVEGLVLALDATGGPLGAASLPAEVRGEGVYQAAAATLRVPRIELRSDGLMLTGEAAGKGLDGDEAVLSGTLAAPEHDLRAWLERRGLAPAVADPDALRRVALSLAWRLAGGRLDLSDLDLTLDATRAHGTAAVLLTEPAGYRFDLAADRLDLDRYRPAPGAANPAPAQSPGPAGPAQAPDAQPAAALLPAGLARLDLSGRLQVEELHGGGLTLADAAFDLSAGGGVLTVANRIGRFYQGRAEGRTGIDLTGAQPRLSLTQRLSGIAAGPLLADLAGDDRLTGSGDAAFDLSATGGTRDALLGSLDGTLSLALRDGVVRGLDLEGLVRAAEARLKGGDGAAPAGDLVFTNLAATARAADGVLTNDDLLLTSAYLRVTGRGTVDLPRQRLDYLFEPMFVKPPRGRGVRELEDIPVPVRVTGSFERPEWRVDLAEALRGQAGQRLQEELTREGGALKKLEERTGIKGLEEGLRGLFGR